jgi:hypothetical protein
MSEKLVLSEPITPVPIIRVNGLKNESELLQNEGEKKEGLTTVRKEALKNEGEKKEGLEATKSEEEKPACKFAVFGCDIDVSFLQIQFLRSYYTGWTKKRLQKIDRNFVRFPFCANFILGNQANFLPIFCKNFFGLSCRRLSTKFLQLEPRKSLQKFNIEDLTIY